MPSDAARIAPRLAALREEVRDIGGRYEVTVEGLSGISVTKLLALQRAGRDPLELNEHAAQMLRDHWKSGLLYAAKRGDLRTFSKADATSLALKRLAQERLPDGADVTFTPDDPDYVLMKIKRGWNPGVGVARGFLKRDLARGRFALRKIG